MNFQICSGNQEKAGVTKQKDTISFFVQAAGNSVCNLLLYPKDDSPVRKISMEVQHNDDTVYTIGIRGLDWKNYDYNYEINGEEVTDLYARRITGREIWADEARRPGEQKAEPFVPEKERKRMKEELPPADHVSPEKQIREESPGKIKSSFYFSDFSWKDKECRRIKKEDMIIYKLHVRGLSLIHI